MRSRGELEGGARAPEIVGGRTWKRAGTTRIGLIAALAAFASAFVPAGESRGDEPAPANWVGRRVVQKVSDFVPRVNDQVVTPRSFILFYKVEQAKDDWLWLKAEGKRLSGWAKIGDLVPADQGIDYFTNQIRLAPLDAFNHEMRATLYHDREELDKALADYNEAIKLDPSHAWVFNNRGIAWTDKRDYDRALADFNEAIRLDPENANVYNNRGSIWRLKRISDEAIADFNDAIRLFPEYAFAFYNRGLAWLDKHEYDRAIADFDHVLALDPQDAPAHYNRGLALLHKKNHDKAIVDFNEALRLDFKTADVYFHRGLANFEIKKQDKAVADFGEALKLDPKYAQAYFNRGLAWAERKDYVKAFADYDQAIRLNPDYDQAYVSRAWLLVSCPDAKFRNPKRAIESATKACELTKWRDPYEIGTLAAAYVEAGDFDAAAKWQSKANELLNANNEDGDMAQRLR